MILNSLRSGSGSPGNEAAWRPSEPRCARRSTALASQQSRLDAGRLCADKQIDRLQTAARLPLVAKALVALFAVLLAACDGKLAHRREGVIQGRVPLSADVGRLDIEVGFGSITVLADDATPDAVTFEGSTLRAADTADGLLAMASVDLTLNAAAADGVLRLYAPALPPSLDPSTARMVVRGIVRCPTRLRVAIRTGLGSVKVDKIGGGVDIDTGLGEVVVSGCGGLATVQSASGDIMVDRHRGSLVLAAPKGSARAYLSELGTAGVQASARSALEVHLPRATTFGLDARTGHGRCHNSFGVPIVIAGSAASMQGDVNGGGARLDLVSVSGPVTVGANDRRDTLDRK